MSTWVIGHGTELSCTRMHPASTCMEYDVIQVIRWWMGREERVGSVLTLTENPPQEPDGKRWLELLEPAQVHATPASCAHYHPGESCRLFNEGVVDTWVDAIARA